MDRDDLSANFFNLNFFSAAINFFSKCSKIFDSIFDCYNNNKNHAVHFKYCPLKIIIKIVIGKGVLEINCLKISMD